MNFYAHETYTKNGVAYYLVDWPTFLPAPEVLTLPVPCRLNEVPMTVISVDPKPGRILHESLRVLSVAPGRPTGISCRADVCFPATLLNDAARFSLVDHIDNQEIAHMLVGSFRRVDPELGEIFSSPATQAFNLPFVVRSAERVLDLAFDGDPTRNPVVAAARRVLEPERHGYWNTAVAARTFHQAWELERLKMEKSLQSPYWVRAAILSYILATKFEDLFVSDKTAAAAVGLFCGYEGGSLLSWKYTV